MNAVPMLGFVGVGTIAEALIDGLCANGEHRADFLLSPRSAERVTRLAGKYPFVKIAASNQAVVDGADIVFLAVRPQIAEQVLGDLSFRPGQRIVSLIATYDTARLRPLVAPATAISRVTPLPAVARCRGPLSLYPPSPEIGALLDGLGQLVQLDDEVRLDALLAVTGFMGSYFGLLETISGWLSRRGVPTEQANAFVAALFNSLGVTAEDKADIGFGQLVLDHSTPGGLNEQAWRELNAAGWGSLVGEALDLLHARVEGRATLADALPVNR
jgi:pyrroline-5-carboxylate reductase